MVFTDKEILSNEHIKEFNDFGLSSHEIETVISNAIECELAEE